MTLLRLATALLLGFCGAAAAQSAAPSTSLDSRPGTLSDKLGETNGVIRPKGDIDPDMHKTTPRTGTMPVIKPGQVPSQSGNGAPQDGSGTAR